MAWTLPEVIVQKVLGEGLRRLRSNKRAFLEIFSDYASGELDADYGADYVEQIWDWFSTTKIPIIQSWSFNPQRIPCISVHLANEQEAEDKLAMDDYAGTFSADETTGTAAFLVMMDIGLHTQKTGEHVLWLYYITSYLLFKCKPALERMGLRMGTFSASDYSKDASRVENSVWTRWIRYRCTTQNFWGADELTTIDELDTIATLTSDGMKVSRIGDQRGEEDLGI
jgi:hypothetical protein